MMIRACPHVSSSVSLCSRALCREPLSPGCHRLLITTYKVLILVFPFHRLENESPMRLTNLLRAIS